MDLKKLKKGECIVWEREAYIVDEIIISADKEANIKMRNLFTGKPISTAVPVTEQLYEANITRRCATIVSKKKGVLEIMDAVTFRTFDAKAEKDILEHAEENDSVTYLQFEDDTKVVEVRKER